MDSKRYKKVRKILQFYKINYKLFPPYSVLVDAEFCRAALSGKVNIREQIPKYIGEGTRIFTTQCIILDTEERSKKSKSSKLYASWLIVKQFPIQKCGHAHSPVSAAECIKSLLESDAHRFIVASHDPAVREFVHTQSSGHHPFLYLHGWTPILEHPSNYSYSAVKNKSVVSELEQDTLSTIKSKLKLCEGKKKPRLKDQPLHPFRRNVKVNPNPLSCKKSKKKNKTEKVEESVSKRRRGRHKRLKKMDIDEG